jgi:hypothetical protein
MNKEIKKRKQIMWKSEREIKSFKNLQPDLASKITVNEQMQGSYGDIATENTRSISSLINNSTAI